MPNGINDISPSLRDWLLNKNLILSDTVVNAGLAGLASGLGYPASIETLPNAVQPSQNIVTNGQFYRDLNLLNNPYKSLNGYDEVDINTNTVVNIGNLPPGTPPLAYQQNIGSENPYSDFNTAADAGREEMLKNKYHDESLLYKVNLNTVLVASQHVGAYDYKATILGRTLDTIANSVGLGGVSQSLGNIGSESPIAQIGNSQLIKHLGYNAAFNTAQETLGHINLNPLSVLMGNDILIPSYQITIPKGQTTTTVDFLGKVLGFETPKSLLDGSSSIFASETPSMTNTDRINSMVLNTGKGQVLSLIANISQNKYKPTITDDRTRENITKGETGTDGELYLFDNGQGGIIDLLSTPPNTQLGVGLAQIGIGDFENGIPNVQQGSSEYEFEHEYGKITSELGGGFNDSFDDLTNKDYTFINTDASRDSNSIGEIATTKFTWTDDKNKIGEELGVYNRSVMKNKKSLLYKTQALFNTNKTRNLITAKGDIQVKPSEIETSVQVGGTSFISKGSQVKTQAALEGNASTPEDVFCRVWTTFDRYNQVQDLQKNDGLNSNVGLRIANNAKFSVLDDNGFVKIAPYITDKPTPDDPKRFMLSLENLAWYDKYQDLPDCEKGPGDPVTGTKGRIMWFPPYDIAFTDTTSVNWDSTNFIGRGEPVYTYNNTERSGTLSFKIIIDYAAYMNDLKSLNVDDDVYASIAAGCMDFDKETVKQLSKPEKDLIEVDNNQKPQEIVAAPEGIEPEPFSLYFPNDSSNIPSDYEDGIVDENEITYSDGFTFEGCKGQSGPARAGSGCPCAQANRTDFGLNVQPLKLPASEAYPSGQDFPNGWLGSSYVNDLASFIVQYCPSCRIYIDGYASADGKQSSNQRLSDSRAKNIESMIGNALVAANDPLGGKRFGRAALGKGVADAESCPKIQDFKCAIRDKILDVDTECKKKARKVTITFKKDAELDRQIQEAIKQKLEDERIKGLSADIKSRFFSECHYFEKLQQEDKVVYDRISDKIRFFHPAFHSITPEGFNSRLNFLHQCTRQGPHIDKEGSDPKNLAFGRAPICILRLGDFYHTKIAIDSLDLSFDPLVWDLNPEGVGVQPMIANVNISFKFIGGSSLQGPINKLQNAVSFNYFANTGIYDTRADYIKLKADPTSRAQYVNGASPVSTDLERYIRESEREGLNNGSKEAPTNQIAEAEKGLGNQEKQE